jgi:hypothetical protein
MRRGGSGVAVLMNPSDRNVTLYRKGQEPRVFRDTDPRKIGDEMPSFTLDARTIFDASDASDASEAGVHE